MTYEDYYEVQEYILNSECMNPEPQLDLSLLESIPKSNGVAPWMHKEEDVIPMVDTTDPENHEPWFLLSNCDVDWGCQWNLSRLISNPLITTQT